MFVEFCENKTVIDLPGDLFMLVSFHITPENFAENRKFWIFGIFSLYDSN